MRLDIRVTPRASRSRIDGVRDGRLIVRVTAPPVDSAANAAVIALLAAALDVPKRQISIAHGETSRNKSVEITGLSDEQVRARLQLAMAP
jgi:uncharacterized protein (TIGR00251 family)